MAINVKHGLGIPGLVGDYESGRKKAMTEGVRIADGQRRPELVAPAVLPREQRAVSGTQVVEPQARNPVQPQRPKMPQLLAPPSKTQESF